MIQDAKYKQYKQQTIKYTSCKQYKLQIIQDTNYKQYKLLKTIQQHQCCRSQVVNIPATQVVPYLSSASNRVS